MIRTDMGDQLSWLGAWKQNMVQGMENVVSAVDTCFVQNNQRNDQQEQISRRICESLAGLQRKLDQNIKDAKQINENHTLMEKRMEQHDKKLKA